MVKGVVEGQTVVGFDLLRWGDSGIWTLLMHDDEYLERGNLEAGFGVADRFSSAEPAGAVKLSLAFR